MDDLKQLEEMTFGLMDDCIHDTGVLLKKNNLVVDTTSDIVILANMLYGSRLQLLCSQASVTQKKKTTIEMNAS
jgi:hypothetical protein